MLLGVVVESSGLVLSSAALSWQGVQTCLFGIYPDLIFLLCLPLSDGSFLQLIVHLQYFCHYQVQSHLKNLGSCTSFPFLRLKLYQKTQHDIAGYQIRLVVCLKPTLHGLKFLSYNYIFKIWTHFCCSGLKD